MKLSRLLLLPLVVLLPLFTGCGKGKDAENKPVDWNKDYQKLNSDPYSLQLTFSSLSMFYPKAEITQMNPSERLVNIGHKTRKDKQHALVVIICREFHFNEGEIDSLISLMQEGNQILMVANSFDENLLNRLQIEQTPFKDNTDSVQQILLPDFNEQPAVFRFKSPDRKKAPLSRELSSEDLLQQFNNLDTTGFYYSAIGYTENAEPDFIMFRSGKGRLLLHTSPMAFSNYFLVQGNNRDYLKYVFSYIDDPVSNIYFIAVNTREAQDSENSSGLNLNVLWNNPTTKAALLLSLLLLVIYIIFETKRKQRIIPVLKPNENSSVAFTETIGRLYYNNKNHGNLAEKMIQHFLEFVRSNYHLNTNMLDAEFVRLLSAKSGIDIAKTDSLIYNIKMVHNNQPVDEAFLFALYTQIQEFYNGK